MAFVKHFVSLFDEMGREMDRMFATAAATLQARGMHITSGAARAKGANGSLHGLAQFAPLGPNGGHMGGFRQPPAITMPFPDVLVTVHMDARPRDDLTNFVQMRERVKAMPW